MSHLNVYMGSATQQATSVVTQTDQNCYEGGTGCFSIYGFEYKPGFDNAVRPQIPSRKGVSHFLSDAQYISWISDSKLAWTMLSAGVGADPLVEISARPISQEPMVCSVRAELYGSIAKHPFQYIILNLGISESFGFVDVEHLPFPAHMKVDYIRVYQPVGEENIGCDPQDFPTQDYINQYADAYANPNLTTWVDDFHQTIPR